MELGGQLLGNLAPPGIIPISLLNDSFEGATGSSSARAVARRKKYNCHLMVVSLDSGDEFGTKVAPDEAIWLYSQ